MDKLSSEINEMMSECQTEVSFEATEYSFVAQGIKLTRQIPERTVISLICRLRDVIEQDDMKAKTERHLGTYDDVKVGLHVGDVKNGYKYVSDCTCIKCGSPEARYVAVQIFTKWDYENKVSNEVGERLEQLCDTCLRMPSECRAGTSHPIPRSGHLIGYVRDGSLGSRSRSAGYYRNPGITRKFTRYVR